MTHTTRQPRDVDTSDRPRQHTLLTVLGTTSNASVYSLEGREREAQLAPLALLDLLPFSERPDSVLAICTPEAKRHSLPLLERALRGKRDLKVLEVPTGDHQEDIYTYLDTVTANIPEEIDLTVDITHGFRHFAFLTYCAVLHLCAVQGVQLRGAYYGLLRREGASPFLDLRPLLELPQWTHALEVLRETGSALPMAEILVNTSSAQDVQAAADDLRCLSEAYLAGLPLEFGRYVSRITARRRSLRRLLHNEHRLPLANDLTKRLVRILEPMALPPAEGPRWKRETVLSRNELRRQANMIDDLFRRENHTVAYGLLSEWTVSWVSWVHGEERTWLNYRRTRMRSNGLLGTMAAVANDSELRDALTTEQIELADFWRHLGEVRNGFAHHGMRHKVLAGDRQMDDARRRIQDYWNRLRTLPQISLSLGGTSSSRVLVSPIGKRPGVLFSAIHAARDGDKDVDLCLAICSKETEGEISNATDKAGYDRECIPLVLEDAFAGGSDQIAEVAQTARKRLVGADEVVVNVTGGTTLMGLAAERLAIEARSLACPTVRRFGLIDRRSQTMQESDPYQVGEPFWLDEEVEHASRD